MAEKVEEFLQLVDLFQPKIGLEDSGAEISARRHEYDRIRSWLRSADSRVPVSADLYFLVRENLRNT